MKALILTEGGRNIGFGHLTRCIFLYEAFGKSKIVIEFMVNGKGPFEYLLKGKRYKVFDWLKENKRIFALIKGIDIVVIDSYLADINFYRKVSQLAEVCVYIDDYKRLDYPKGIVVNGSIYAEEIDYPKKEDITYLLGTKYAPLRKAFWEVPERKTKERMESVMITFGGNDERDLTPKILNFLNKHYKELIKNIVIGKGFQNIKEIENLKDKRTNLTYYPDAEMMKKVMLESDIAISSGGQTLYELARMGVPTLGICVSENQESNLSGFHEYGSLEFIGWYNDNNLDGKMEEVIKKFSINEERIKRSSLGQKLIDGQGAGRVMSKILENYERG